MKNLNHFLCDLVQYYYDDLGNINGGNLHIALDDGNLNTNHIWFCQEKCEKNRDDFGYFIATLMRHFTENELEKLYETDWDMH